MKKLIEIMCGTLAGLALFSIMVLTFLDVSGRKLLSQSITGSLELTELLMVIVIFGALPLVSLKSEHVVFDSLDAVLPGFVKTAQRALINMVCAALLLGLAVLLWNTGLEFGAMGETTAQLKIAKSPFIQGMGVMCGLTGLVHLSMVFMPDDESTTEASEASEGGTL